MILILIHRFIIVDFKKICQCRRIVIVNIRWLKLSSREKYQKPKFADIITLKFRSPQKNLFRTPNQCTVESIMVWSLIVITSRIREKPVSLAWNKLNHLLYQLPNDLKIVVECSLSTPWLAPQGKAWKKSQGCWYVSLISGSTSAKLMPSRVARGRQYTPRFNSSQLLNVVVSNCTVIHEWTRSILVQYHSQK